MSAGPRCERRSGCPGIMVGAHRACAATGIAEFEQCGGAGFSAEDGAAVGACAPYGASLGDEIAEPLYCIKKSPFYAQCMTLPRWRTEVGEAAGLPEVLECNNAAGAATTAGVCCGYGSVPLVQVQDGVDKSSTSCPWVIGKAADGSGPECCLEVDACGICGGSGKSIDADSASHYDGQLCVC
jgi:hypothetical protein